MRRATRPLMIVVLAALVGGAGVAPPAGAAAPAKKLDACKVLTLTELEEIVGSPVSNPNPSKSVDASSCGFEYGDGLGSTSGGVLVLQLWKGKLGKNIYRATKKTDELVGDVYWNAETGIATGREGNVTINASLTGAGDHRDVSVDLVEAVAADL